MLMILVKIYSYINDTWSVNPEHETTPQFTAGISSLFTSSLDDLLSKSYPATIKRSSLILRSSKSLSSQPVYVYFGNISLLVVAHGLILNK